MSQTQTVEEAFREWKRLNNYPGHHPDLEVGFKAGYELAAKKTLTECAVLEAAKHWANSCRSIGLSVKTRANGAQSLLDAVAALEREKVEGGK